LRERIKYRNRGRQTESERHRQTDAKLERRLHGERETERK
jgi:hypothetical protein